MASADRTGLENEVPPGYVDVFDDQEFEFHEDDYSESLVFSGTYLGTFLKRFRDGESDSSFLKVLRKLNGEEPFSRERRLESARKAEKLRQVGAFQIPELINAGDGVAEMEEVDGTDFYEEAKNSTLEEAFELGHELGSRLEVAHRNDLALRDFNKGNFLVEEGFEDDTEIFYVDTEYFKDDATALDKRWDVMILNYASVEYLEENYPHVMNGFMEGYGASDLEMLAYTGLNTLNELVFGDTERGKETMYSQAERLKEKFS